MGLKTLHVVFVIASCLVTAFFGVWGWREYFSPTGTGAHLAYGVSSIIALVALLFYGRYFFKKLKHISYL